MTTGSPERNGPDPAQIWMLKAKRTPFPVHIQIGSRRREVERVVTTWPFEVIDYGLSRKWVPTIHQYLHDSLQLASYPSSGTTPFLSLP